MTTPFTRRTLDHHPSEHWDPRSVQLHGIKRLVTHPSDFAADTSNKWWPGASAHLDQGQTGHCGGFGLANEAGATPFRVRVNDDYGHAAYYEIKDRGLDPWGREEGTSSLAVAKLGVIRGLWKSYWWAEDEDDIWNGLGLGPMCFGLSWMTGMFTPDKYGFIHPTGVDEGGHFICGTGRSNNYLRRGRTVRIRQSWGLEHGVNGNVYIPLSELADLMLGKIAYKGEGFVPVDRAWPATTPPAVVA